MMPDMGMTNPFKKENCEAKVRDRGRVRVVGGMANEEFAVAVRAETGALADMLIDKNRAYGNSALAPVRIFSKADPIEQLKVRIDDKLSRLARGSDAGEDVTADLLGYLVLLRIALRK